MPVLYPLLFDPVYKSYLWGGNRLSTRYQRTGVPDVCAESWEIADRPEGMSIVANGVYKGRTLHSLVQEYGTSLLGASAQDTTFPLLVKVIDARRDLSVQVHPNKEGATRFGGDPKTEMWYILEAEPDSVIYSGLKPNITRAAFEDAIRNGSIEKEMLAAVPARPGRAVFVPGGRIHAIGAGCLLLEIQQNSNTTYRVHDWNRKDANGCLRDLHLDAVMQVTNWSNALPEVVSPRRIDRDGPNEYAAIITCPYFCTVGISLRESEEVRHTGESFHAIFVVRGRVLIGAGGIVAVLDKGASCLIAAAATTYTLTPVGGSASVIRISRPQPNERDNACAPPAR